MHGTFRATEARGNGRKATRPLHPNAGVNAAYRVRLEKLVEAMHESVRYWVRTRYRNNSPLVAADEERPGLRGSGLSGDLHAAPLLAMDDILPANELRRTLRDLVKRWQKNFDKAAPKLADYFALDVSKRTDASLRKILKDGGFSVKFTMSREMRDVFNATRAANVALIKSIPQQYLKNVEGAVMRSVQTGRDLGQLTKYLEKNYGVTKRRAAFIAKSQNNLATASMGRARQLQNGITTAKWLHSGGGKEPRPTHVKNSGKLYDVRKGWYDPAVKRWIFPGQEPNCRCVSIPVIPGFS